MTEIGVLLVAVFAVIAVGAGVWAFILKKDLEHVQDALQREREASHEHIRGRYLKKMTGEITVYDSEVATADDPKKKYVRARQRAIEKVIRQLLDDEYIYLTRSDLPAKPGVTFKARMYAARPSDNGNLYNELSDVSSDDLLWDRNARPKAA